MENISLVAIKSQKLAVVLQALADPTRLQVVDMLSASPRRAGELAAAIGVPPASISKHVRVLMRAGLVSDERLSEDARARVFRLRGESMTPVRTWLDELQSHWDRQLGSFKRHVERKGKA
jgi:DNA-binding transcriptional ArsR family regulator